MKNSALRYAGNYVALIGLLFAATLGADRLAVWLGWKPRAGCFLASVAVLNRTVSVWVVTLGVLMAIIGWNRRFGFWLILAGVVFSQLPGFLSAHLGPFCTST